MGQRLRHDMTSWCADDFDRDAGETRALILEIAERMAALARGHAHESMIEGFIAEVRSARALPAAEPATPSRGAISASMRGANDTALAHGVVALSERGELRWRAPSRLPDAGSKVAICDLNGRFDVREYTAGLMFLDPREAYPPHAHAPAEFYLVLSGKADWRYGGASEYRSVDSGSLLYNPPSVTHGVVAGPDPCLAFFLLHPRDDAA